ncbi:MAG: hypothetical protein WBJ36_03485 [Tenuifilum sp.]|uniref:hypothetical protein n=1 Tax=Tenuifilum sp. TaxID=2760880 RepID=UPI003C91F859
MSKGEALHRNRKAPQRAISQKTTRVKGKETLRLTQHDSVMFRLRSTSQITIPQQHLIKISAHLYV